jgi:hypothetical protein
MCHAGRVTAEKMVQVLLDFAMEWQAVAAPARQAAPQLDFTRLDALANQAQMLDASYRARTAAPGTSGVTASDTTGAAGTTLPGQSGTHGITSLSPGASGTSNPTTHATPADTTGPSATGTGGVNESQAPKDNAPAIVPAADTTGPSGTTSVTNPNAAPDTSHPTDIPPASTDTKVDPTATRPEDTSFEAPAPTLPSDKGSNS